MSNKSMMEDIKDFHTKFELDYDGPPRQLEQDMNLFRIGFLIEELSEYAQSCGYMAISHELNFIEALIRSGDINTRANFRDLEVQFDSLIDLVYVALGTAHLQGFDFQEGWNRVQKANMAKVRVKNLSDSKRASTFDVVKPEGWEAPDLSDLVKC